MNRKQFLLVLAALALIGSAGLVLLNHSKESWTVREPKMGDKVLPHFRLNDVAAIHVKSSFDINVVRKNGLWRVQERGDYPADYNLIRDLLIKIMDMKVVQSEMVGPSQLASVNLEPPEGSVPSIDARSNAPLPLHQGTLLEFKDAQGKVKGSVGACKMRLRHQEESVPFGLHGLFDGRYVLLPSDPGNVLLISDELANVAPGPESWLSRDFFKIQKIQFVALVSTNA